MLDPFGDQRADMRMAQLAGATLQPHLKPGARIDLRDFLLFPDDAIGLDDGLSDDERQLMLKMDRMGG